MWEKLKSKIKGDVETSSKTLQDYSHDTSLFEVMPSAVVFPRDVDDVGQVVKFAMDNKAKHPDLSITARSGGTCMSGGAINDSLIMSFGRYFNKLNDVQNHKIKTQPGVAYRDFEKVTLASGLIMPSYPASRELCDVGGMVGNRAGGEKSLVYGTTEKFVESVKVVLRDGKEYTFKPLDKKELDKKMKQKDLEGEIYKKVFKIVDENDQLVKAARPPVTKNTTGYALWDVWDNEKEVFDLSKLFVGSQGTLGLITEIEFSLVPHKQYSGLLIGYLPSLDQLGDLIPEIIKHNPTSFETFDDHTLKFAIKFFLQFRKTLGWMKFIKLGLSFIPDVLIMAKGILLGKGLPKQIMLIEYEGDSEDEVKEKLDALKEDILVSNFDILLEEAETEAKSERFWLMRRESFNLLRKNVKGNIHTAPFIDDLIVPTKHLPKFLPDFRKILEKYELLYTIAGHMGDGNFHVIPLMDFSDKSELNKIEPALKECINLVKKYDGSMSGEHNDGMIRGPFLKDIYGPDVFKLFQEVKEIFDPLNIFNPHKKTDATWKWSKKHMREHF